MLIKSADSKNEALGRLEQLLHDYDLTDYQYNQIKREIYMLKAGLKGEEDSAYLLNFHFKDSEYSILIHDLRLEINGRVAQIDHLLINRALRVFVLESKHFHAGIKITEQGEFLSWNDYKKQYEGIPSPLAQNERHIAVLKDAFNQINMPSRFGLKLNPELISFILLSSNARIDRPKNFNTDQVIKADVATDAIQKTLNNYSFLQSLGALTKLVSLATLQAIGKELCKLHKPMPPIDYTARFGLKPKISTKTTFTEVACKHCHSHNVSIHYKHNYYIKCNGCQKNTAIKLGCGKEDCIERLRKENSNFFRECKQCNSSQLYYINPSLQCTV